MEGTVIERSERLILLKTRAGVVYSIPRESIRSESDGAETATSRKTSVARPQRAGRLPEKKIRVDEEEKKRLLAELEKNHSGKVPPKQSWETAKPVAAAETVEVTERSDETYWREEARKRTEGVRRAREHYELLTRREQEIEDQVRMLLGRVHNDHLGHHMIALADTRTMREQARLDIDRAQRDLDALHDDARREGILPGWLR